MIELEVSRFCCKLGIYEVCLFELFFLFSLVLSLALALLLLRE